MSWDVLYRAAEAIEANKPASPVDLASLQWFSKTETIETGVNLPRVLPMRPRKPAKRIGQ